MQHYALSIPYIQDDVTWCVSAAKALPVFLNIYRNCDYIIWCLFIISIIVDGYILYMLSRNDDESKHKNQNIYFMVLLVAIPAVVGIGMNSKFIPKKFTFRTFYGCLLFCGVVGMIFWCSVSLTRALYIYREIQVDRVDQLIERNYELASSPATFSKIFMQQKVILKIFLK